MSNPYAILLWGEGDFPGLETLDDLFVFHRVKIKSNRLLAPESKLLMQIRGILCAHDCQHRLTAEVMQNMPALSVVVTSSVGVDHIDTSYAQKHGVVVTNAPGAANVDAADMAIFLALAVYRRQVAMTRLSLSRQWQKKSEFRGRSFSGTKSGILGLGDLGERLAKRLQAFGCEVVYHSRRRKPVRYQYFQSVVDMANHVDTLFVCLPGGDATRHCVNAEVLQSLGPDGVLVNVGRGSVVDEQALIFALQQQTIAGAGLDVFEHEPWVPNPSMTFDNLVLTPHIGGNTWETYHRLYTVALANLKHYFETGKGLTPWVEVDINEKKPGDGLLSQHMSDVDLTQLTCSKLEDGLVALDQPLIESYRLQLSPAWTLTEDGRLQADHRTKNFKESLTLANQIGQLAESEGHHPDMTVRYGGCSILLWTHDINGLSINDFILAAKIDGLLK